MPQEGFLEPFCSRVTIQGDDFVRALFVIWLGADTLNGALKAGLLGGESG